jgi:hypothetical protein
MRDVYRNAAFCIAATAAADGTVGLFRQRDPACLRPVKIDLLWPKACNELSASSITPPTTGTYAIGCHYLYPSWELDATVLNRRAWVRCPSDRLLFCTARWMDLCCSSSRMRL